MSRTSIVYRGQVWEKTRTQGWVAKCNVEASKAFTILEMFEDGEADHVMAELFSIGVIYTGEVIALTSCKNPTDGHIRLAVYVSVVK